MRIDGLSQSPRASQTSQRDDVARGKKESGRVGDVVEISHAQEVANLSAAANATPDELNPRLQEVRERSQSGYYDSREVQKQVADALIDSSGLRDVVSEAAQVQAARQRLEEVPDIRPEEVDRARSRVGSGFYDDAKVQQDTADRILDELA